MLEQPLQALRIAPDFRIYLAICPFEICVGDNCRTAVTRPGQIDHVQIVLFDHAIQVRVDKVLTRRSSPMPEQHPFDVLKL